MLLTYFLSTLLSTTSSLPTTTDPYNCGYVLTRHNSSAYAGIYALNRCVVIYYNETIRDYQDAYAYHMFGGCECRFFGASDPCVSDVDGPVFKGPTEENGVLAFEEPKPKWYRCERSA